METQQHINDYITALPETKRADMLQLHQHILGMAPGCKLWFLDGKDSTGKVVSNPNIGYGTYTMTYAKGETREFYRVGISANTTGISVYIMGIKDKAYLLQTYAPTLGKATITGYCIKFKTLKDINLDVLTEAIRYGLEGKK